MRNNFGQFQKGYTYRKPQPYWGKEWLFNEYIIKKRSSSDIAKQFNCTDTNVQYFLKKFKIKTRSVSEARKIKHWGLKGKQNGMYGRFGKQNPNWNGGHSLERQSLYARSAWKELAKSILKRDNYKCQECGAGHKDQNKLIVHHKKAWSKYPELRFEINNLITLCDKCHRKIHSNKK